MRRLTTSSEAKSRWMTIPNLLEKNRGSLFDYDSRLLAISDGVRTAQFQVELYVADLRKYSEMRLVGLWTRS